MFICELLPEDLRFDAARVQSWEGPVNRIASLADVRFRRREWSNCELAQFHRMLAILCDVGLAFETDSGMTDEGDPWLVFCEVDSDEIFVHFARISGEYVVCAPCLNQPVTGAALHLLVDLFIDLCSRRRAAAARSRNTLGAQ